MKRIAPAVVAAALLLAPTVVPAQSLGDVAVKEKEKKDKDKTRKPAKNYTEEDLRGKLNGTMSNPGATANPTGEASATPASPAPDAAASPTPEDREALAKNWRARRDQTQAEVSRITAAIASFESRLADNTQPMYGPGREALTQNLARAKADLTRAQADLATVEAEGRSNSYR